MDERNSVARPSDQAGRASHGAAISVASPPFGDHPSREFYQFSNGWAMRREGAYAWHLRSDTGELVDRDQYRHDLIARHRLSVVNHYDPTAIAMEARRGETENTGSTAEGGDSAGRKASPKGSTHG